MHICRYPYIVLYLPLFVYYNYLKNKIISTQKNTILKSIICEFASGYLYNGKGSRIRKGKPSCNIPAG